MKCMKWLKGHPRVVLAATWALFGLACFLVATTDISLLVMVVTGGALMAVNGMALRQRHRTLVWLWFYIIGAGIVPLAVALFAPSKQPVDDHVRSLS